MSGSVASVRLVATLVAAGLALAWPSAVSSGATADESWVGAELHLRRAELAGRTITLVYKGRSHLPLALDPAFAPDARGARLRFGVLGTTWMEVHLAPGPFSPATRCGWKSDAVRGIWRYVGPRQDPPGGIARLRIRDRWRQQPGAIEVALETSFERFDRKAFQLPLELTLVFDAPPPAPPLDRRRGGA